MSTIINIFSLRLKVTGMDIIWFYFLKHEDFTLRDNNGTIYLVVKHMLTELLQPKVGTIWCIYTI